jgi:hypothetical protein
LIVCVPSCLVAEAEMALKLAQDDHRAAENAVNADKRGKCRLSVDSR